MNTVVVTRNSPTTGWELYSSQTLIFKLTGRKKERYVYSICMYIYIYMHMYICFFQFSFQFPFHCHILSQNMSGIERGKDGHALSYIWEYKAKSGYLCTYKHHINTYTSTRSSSGSNSTTMLFGHCLQRKVVKEGRKKGPSLCV